MEMVVSILVHLSVNATPSTCNVANNQYSLNGSITFTNPPTSGTLTVTNSCGGTQSFNAPFVSPQAYIFSNLTSNGASCTVTSSFSAIPGCTATTTYNAPAACATSCSVTGITTTNIGACQSATNTFTLGGQVSFTNAPTTGTLTVTSSCGGTQILNPPFNSPMNYNLSGLTANGGPCSVTATFSATACTGSQNFNAPAACGCSISALTASPTACANDLYNVSGSATS